jgi:hypothetical protein
VVASLLAMRPWLESTRPDASSGRVSADEYGLAQWEAVLGAVTTFREAARLWPSWPVCTWAARRCARKLNAGTELEGQQRRTMTYVDQAHESPAAPGMRMVETDGVMVRYRDRHLDGALVEGDWHEVKLGLVGGWQDGHLQQPSYVHWSVSLDFLPTSVKP